MSALARPFKLPSLVHHRGTLAAVVLGGGPGATGPGTSRSEETPFKATSCHSARTGSGKTKKERFGAGIRPGPLTVLEEMDVCLHQMSTSAPGLEIKRTPPPSANLVAHFISQLAVPPFLRRPAKSARKDGGQAFILGWIWNEADNLGVLALLAVPRWGGGLLSERRDIKVSKVAQKQLSPWRRWAF